MFPGIVRERGVVVSVDPTTAGIRLVIEDPETAGYWVSRAVVDPLERLTVDDLIGRHAAAEITLHTAPNVWPLWDEVVASTLEFSGMRLRNARPRAEPSET